MKPAKNPPRLPESEIVARVIRNFVVKPRRQRYLTMLAKPNAHGGYGFGELAHFVDKLDLRFCKLIPGGEQYVSAVLEKIRSLTETTECYIMHENRELDGQWMDLQDALYQILGRNLGAFVIVDNGDIIYHESETMKHRYLGVRRGLA
ncbi:hypothetical protein [Hymenobacter negativus]|uniref:Uncharacterized protein n=1 Tax=Hymenobacter negativus TaxID=2795026 RepID=A0ABS3QGH3_9BACT|nr:hypothetical protein [Hymenobacter negativus]MBO2010352.1 hypothetical protein [Hymenobacter negativus]